MGRRSFTRFSYQQTSTEYQGATPSIHIVITRFFVCPPSSVKLQALVYDILPFEDGQCRKAMLGVWRAPFYPQRLQTETDTDTNANCFRNCFEMFSGEIALRCFQVKLLSIIQGASIKALGLTPSLPRCHLKTTNESAKSETLKPFVYFSHRHEKRFSSKRVALTVDVIGPENLRFVGAPVHLSARKLYRLGQ